MMKNKTFTNIAFFIIEISLSLTPVIFLGLAGIFNNWLYAIYGVPFLINSISICLSYFNKKTLKASSIVEFINSPIAMVILLIAAISNYLIIGELPFKIFITIYLAYRIATTIIYGIKASKENDYLLESKFNLSLVSLIYIVNLVLYVFLNVPENEELNRIFILIKILVNAITTVMVAYYSLSYLVVSFAEERLKMKAKILAVAKFFTKYSVGFIFGSLFLFIAFMVNLFTSKDNQVHQYLAAFYIVIFIIRLVTFIWNKSLEKKVQDPYTLSKRKNVLLIVNSAFFIASSETLFGGLTALSVERYGNSMSWWFFLAFMFPFMVFNFIHAIINKKAAKKIDNAYIEVDADQSLLTSIYTLFAGITFFMKFIPDENLRGIIYIYILFTIIILQPGIFVGSLVKGIIGVRGKRDIQEKQGYLINNKEE